MGFQNSLPAFSHKNDGAEVNEDFGAVTFKPFCRHSGYYCSSGPWS